MCFTCNVGLILCSWYVVLCKKRVCVCVCFMKKDQTTVKQTNNYKLSSDFELESSDKRWWQRKQSVKTKAGYKQRKAWIKTISLFFFNWKGKWAKNGKETRHFTRRFYEPIYDTARCIPVQAPIWDSGAPSIRSYTGAASIWQKLSFSYRVAPVYKYNAGRPAVWLPFPPVTRYLTASPVSYRTASPVSCRTASPVSYRRPAVRRQFPYTVAHMSRP